MTSIPRRRALGVLVPIACVALLTQCETTLDTQPFGSLNTGTYYTSAKDFESATIGAYSTLQNLTFSGRDHSIFRNGLLPDDDTRSPGSNQDNDFTWTSDNTSIVYIWEVSYRAVLRANLILQQLDQTDQLTDAQKARYAGEAKFIRAYFNFILARYFGTPPVLTEVATTIDETRPGNSQPGEIWDLMESDLEDAITGLAGQKLENGRASEWAARALLGKVELYRAQWFNNPAKYQEAATHLQEVVSSGQFSLVPYEDNFKYTTENNPESIFELQASFGTDINGWAAVDENGGGASSGSGRPLATGAGGYNGVNAPGGFDWGDGGIIVTTSLVDEFEDGDPRAYFTFYSTGEQYGHACGNNPAPYNYRWSCDNGNVVVGTQSNWSVTGYTPSKYIRPYENYAGGGMLNQSVSQNNERLIRYGDVLLMLAEAKLLGSSDVAGAAALVNEVRARARAAYDRAYGAQSIDAALYADMVKPANLLPDRPSTASVPQMFEWIMHERRVELALEITRYDDLVRWLRAGLIQRADIDFGDPTANSLFDPSKNLLRPIPLGELDLDKKLVQNPGY